MHPALVAVLGDEQYQNGDYSDFENSYDKYWGAFKFLQRPAPGNHEFYDNHGQTGVRGLGYFDYFNGLQHNADGSEVDTTVTNPSTGRVVTQPVPQQAGQAGQFGSTGNGWYSYNLGAWHLISLNIECADEPGGCSPTGSWFAGETKWLAQDLNENRSRCTLAYWHQPTFSPTASPFTSDSAEGQTADTWWKLPYAHHATLILNGHDHVYSRFTPMDPNRQLRPAPRDPRVHHRHRRRGARHGAPVDAEPPGLSRPVLRRHEAHAQAGRLQLGLPVGAGEPHRAGGNPGNLW